MINIYTIKKNNSKKYCHFFHNIRRRLRIWNVGIIRGSLIRTFFGFPLIQNIWSGTFLLFLFLRTERINFIFCKTSPGLVKNKKQQSTLYLYLIPIIIFSFQIGKTGLLFSLFLDAFKVGSSLWNFI